MRCGEVIIVLVATQSPTLPVFEEECRGGYFLLKPPARSMLGGGAFVPRPRHKVSCADFNCGGSFIIGFLRGRVRVFFYDSGLPRNRYAPRYIPEWPKGCVPPGVRWWTFALLLAAALPGVPQFGSKGVPHCLELRDIAHLLRFSWFFPKEHAVDFRKCVLAGVPHFLGVGFCSRLFNCPADSQPCYSQHDDPEHPFFYPLEGVGCAHKFKKRYSQGNSVY